MEDTPWGYPDDRCQWHRKRGPEFQTELRRAVARVKELLESGEAGLEELLELRKPYSFNSGVSQRLFDRLGLGNLTFLRALEPEVLHQAKVLRGIKTRREARWAKLCPKRKTLSSSSCSGAPSAQLLLGRKQMTVPTQTTMSPTRRWPKVMITASSWAPTAYRPMRQTGPWSNAAKTPATSHARALTSLTACARGWRWRKSWRRAARPGMRIQTRDETLSWS